MQKKTKIVATIGPASEDPETLSRLYKAGVDVIRLNFSHGDYAEHAVKINNWNEVISQGKGSGAVMADLSGPEIRTGDLPNGPLSFSVGDTIALTTDADSTDTLSVNYPGLLQDVSPGDKILIDDGSIAFTVTELDDTTVTGEVSRGGEIASSGRGVNVPGVELSLPSLTEKDLKDLEFALEQKVDFVAMSFVKTADDISLLKEKLAEHKAEEVKVVAKIETRSAVDNLEGIIELADAVMVARGDLAVEVSLESVPVIQKQIIEQCNAAGVPVITATQMLESMTDASTPTRAEASDVANAILDGSDAIMLSGETAMGKYPVKSVEVMGRIAAEIEAKDAGINQFEIQKSHQKPVNAITASVVRVAKDIKASAIVALTDSGFTARMISRYRPKQDIIAFSPHQHTCRRLSISYGCEPNFLKEAGDTEPAIKLIKKLLLDRPNFNVGDRIVIAAGISSSADHLGTNALLIAEL